MASYRGARRAARRARARRIRAAGLLGVIAVVAAALGWQLPSSSSTAAPPSHVVPKEPPRPPAEARRDRPVALGEAGGAVPSGTTVFDQHVPGVANLDPALLEALRWAAADAAAAGVQLVVDSGWRSPAYQERLLHEAVWKYGSEEEAARWVATPNTSAHVSGAAVDIGPPVRSVAVRRRRRVRAVSGLRQRALALRAALRRRRSRLPSDVRRRCARSEDEAVTVRRARRDARESNAASVRP